MATKREVLDQFRRGEGILHDADEDEPIFVLRAEDKFFVPLVRLWIELMEMDAPEPTSCETRRKAMEAVDIANDGIDWQKNHQARVKMSD